jgi:hypothetical protein
LKFQSRHAWHYQVDDRHVKGSSLGKLPRLLSVCGALHLQSSTAKPVDDAAEPQPMSPFAPRKGASFCGAKNGNARKKTRNREVVVRGCCGADRLVVNVGYGFKAGTICNLGATQLRNPAQKIQTIQPDCWLLVCWLWPVFGYVKLWTERTPVNSEWTAAVE